LGLTLSNVWLVMGVSFLSFNVFSQSVILTAPQIANTKKKLNDACFQAFSGSSYQIDSCISCARSSSDINSYSFNKCMANYDEIFNLQNGQDSLDNFMKSPGCIKGVKSSGC
jgi:hypothetical protein